MIPSARTKRAAPTRPPLSRTPSTKSAKTGDPRPPIRILVAEDNIINQKVRQGKLVRTLGPSRHRKLISSGSFVAGDDPAAQARRIRSHRGQQRTRSAGPPPRRVYQDAQCFPDCDGPHGHRGGSFLILSSTLVLTYLVRPLSPPDAGCELFFDFFFVLVRELTHVIARWEA
jgi:hypothetical protein